MRGISKTGTVLAALVAATICLPLSTTAQPSPMPPFAPPNLPAWSSPVAMGPARTLFSDKPECLVSAQNRIDCYALGDAVTGNAASGEAGAVFRTAWDGAAWSTWTQASPPGLASRDAMNAAGKPGRPACVMGGAGLTACYIVANFAPAALPQNADIRFAAGQWGSSGPAQWWSDLGQVASAKPVRFAGTPLCSPTPNNGLSCAVYGRTTPLTGDVYTRLLSNGLWGPWAQAFEGGDAPLWTCATRQDGRIDCLIASRSVDPATRVGTRFTRHIVFDPQGAQAGYNPGTDPSGAAGEIAADPQCTNAMDQLTCFLLTDVGTGPVLVRLSLQHQPGASWTMEPVGFRQAAAASTFTANDIADFDCSTGATSSDIDCVVALKNGRLARYTKTAAQEVDWRLVDVKSPLQATHLAMSCRLSADRAKKHCFAISTASVASGQNTLRHIALDSIMPRLRPIRGIDRPIRPVVSPVRPPPNP